MYIDMNIQKHSEAIVKLAYESYKKEIETHPGIFLKMYEEYNEFMKQELSIINGFVCVEGEKCLGYILYNTWEENGDIYCRIPEWGCGAVGEKREKVISCLFQTLADEVVGEKTIHFSVNLYANDVEMQRLFSHMEFGTQAEVGICQLEKTDVSNTIAIREIAKNELENRWNDIWNLLSQLINHLKKSPIFYSGEEFTEDVYKEFFADAGTRVYIAEKDRKIIGLIEANEDTILPVFSNGEAANVGEVFVLPKYRGMAIAQALLAYACADLAEDGYRFAWVEHGTANPNARYFWNKYFATYRYEMIRTIGKR